MSEKPRIRISNSKLKQYKRVDVRPNGTVEIAELIKHVDEWYEKINDPNKQFKSKYLLLGNILHELLLEPEKSPKIYMGENSKIQNIYIHKIMDVYLDRKLRPESLKLMQEINTLAEKGFYLKDIFDLYRNYVNFNNGEINLSGFIVEISEYPQYSDFDFENLEKLTMFSPLLNQFFHAITSLLTLNEFVQILIKSRFPLFLNEEEYDTVVNTHKRYSIHQEVNPHPFFDSKGQLRYDSDSRYAVKSVNEIKLVSNVQVTNKFGSCNLDFVGIIDHFSILYTPHPELGGFTANLTISDLKTVYSSRRYKDWSVANARMQLLLYQFFFSGALLKEFFNVKEVQDLYQKYLKQILNPIGDLMCNIRTHVLNCDTPKLRKSEKLELKDNDFSMFLKTFTEKSVIGVDLSHLSNVLDTSPFITGYSLDMLDNFNNGTLKMRTSLDPALASIYEIGLAETLKQNKIDKGRVSIPITYFRPGDRFDSTFPLGAIKILGSEIVQR